MGLDNVVQRVIVDHGRSPDHYVTHGIIVADNYLFNAFSLLHVLGGMTK